MSGILNVGHEERGEKMDGSAVGGIRAQISWCVGGGWGAAPWSATWPATWPAPWPAPWSAPWFATWSAPLRGVGALLWQWKGFLQWVFVWEFCIWFTLTVVFFVNINIAIKLDIQGLLSLAVVVGALRFDNRGRWAGGLVEWLGWWVGSGGWCSLNKLEGFQALLVKNVSNPFLTIFCPDIQGSCFLTLPGEKI